MVASNHVPGCLHMRPQHVQCNGQIARVQIHAGTGGGQQRLAAAYAGRRALQGRQGRAHQFSNVTGART